MAKTLNFGPFFFNFEFVLPQLTTYVSFKVVRFHDDVEYFFFSFQLNHHHRVNSTKTGSTQSRASII